MRAAMEEIIGEEEALPVRSIVTNTAMNPRLLPNTAAGKVDEQVVTPTRHQVQDTIKDISIDDDVEEDFELISADELSLHEDS